MPKFSKGYQRQVVKRELPLLVADMDAQKEDRYWEHFMFWESMDGHYDHFFGVDSPEAEKLAGSFSGSLYGL